MPLNSRSLVREISNIVLGKEHQIKMALCCVLARGHLLIEDLPGTGKTTLARALVQVLGLEFQRVQFTSDLLPADVLGMAIFDREDGDFRFHPGPIFTQFLLVDEINRASPKTQSALLEAMAEYQVTVEGLTRPLPEPFFVIATQNPVFQSGTFALPESQLDRFLMRIELGYPDAESERLLLEGGDPREKIEKLSTLADAALVIEAQQAVGKIEVRSAVLGYVQRLVAFTRQDSHFAYGLSTRASLALLQCARAWAMLDDRSHVLPEDIQTILPAIAGHRLQASAGVSDSSEALVKRMLDEVPVLA